MPSRPPDAPVVDAPAAEQTPGGRSAGGPRWWRDDRGERWLVAAVIAAAVLVLVGAVALAASLSGTSTPGPSPRVAAPTTPHPHGHGGTPTGGGTTTTSSVPSSSTSTSSPPRAASTTTTLAAVPGAAPVIAALNPASGAVGQAIQVAGSNFLSASGQIVATFNGQVAPTSCPAQNSCTVTVPQMTSASSAQVVITTASGTSNPVTFTYS